MSFDINIHDTLLNQVILEIHLLTKYKYTQSEVDYVKFCYAEGSIKHSQYNFFKTEQLPFSFHEWMSKQGIFWSHALMVIFVT